MPAAAAASSSYSPGRRLLLLGASGETGCQALLAALASPSVSHVFSFGRSAPAVDAVHSDRFTHVPLDFERLLSEGDTPGAEAKKLHDADADAVLVALGAKMMRDGKARFERTDREYVLAAAKAARREDKPDQRVLLISAVGASSSSMFMYTRSKGLTEEGLAAMGYAETVLFHPGIIAIPGGRSDANLVERAFTSVSNLFATFSNSLQVPTPTLGSAMVNAALYPPEALKVPQYGQGVVLKGKPAWLVGNAAAIRLAGESSGKL
ncbi:hypothetical protein JCM10207_004026 [Rhodosporidiobolus poonsookiae]